MKTYNVIIIGSGPAGLTAAIYNGRADLSPLVIAGEEWGGQLMGTSVVENFPGFPEGIMGPQLMMNMQEQAKKYGAEFIYKNATEIDLSGEIKVVKIGEEEYRTKAIILAMGAAPRKLGIPGEQEFWGKGVSSCATCDGALYRDKVVAVVGGGDSAVEEATFLTRFASKVYLIHRREELRASEIMQKRVLENEKVEILWNTEITEVKGDGIVKSLSILNNKSNETSELELSGMFLAIGHIPNTGVLDGKLDTNDEGYLEIVSSTQTSVEGVFVAGDVHDHHYQQAITAAGMGCKAALDVESWLESNK